MCSTGEYPLVSGIWNLGPDSCAVDQQRTDLLKRLENVRRNKNTRASDGCCLTQVLSDVEQLAVSCRR